MSDRQQLMFAVERQLQGRQLVWAGIRGGDIEPLRDLPQLTASFTIADRYFGRTDVAGVSYEQFTQLRVDPEIWDINEHHSEPATVEFRQGLLRALASRSALLPYRSSSFLSAIHFARRDRCLRLGMFGAQQSAFEHKPFVESSIADLGVPHIPWTYIADEEQIDVLDLAAHGPLILRRSRTSGGEGFTRVDRAEDVVRHWPKVDEAFVSVAPFIEHATPVNVGATVWANAGEDDCVSVHQPSVQLIGINSCVTRSFGYCGNDFGAARELDQAILRQIEDSTVTVGRWLRRNGYVGSFGVDFLVKNGVALFTEINPRFQGSTATSCRLSIEQGESCLMLEHVAAWLGVAKPKTAPMLERVNQGRDLSNVVVHWTGEEPNMVSASKLAVAMSTHERVESYPDVLVPRDVLSAPGSVVLRMGLGRQVTTTGYDLTGGIDEVIDNWKREQPTQ